MLRHPRKLHSNVMMSLSYNALFFALLTQAGQTSTAVSAEPSLHRHAANNLEDTNWTVIARSPLRLRRDFLAPSNQNAPLSEHMHVFGTIVNKKSESVRCEGVLLSDRVVLTVSKCFVNYHSKVRIRATADPKTLAFKFLQSTFSIEDYTFRDDFHFSVALLNESTRSSHVPHAYAFPMWAGEWQTKDANWRILPEQIRLHPYRLSSYYTAKNELKQTIRDALESCQFENKAELIALRCRGNFAIRDGASFFRQITNNPLTRAVAVPALVLKDRSFESCSESKSHRDYFNLDLSMSPEPEGVYYCGPRFTYCDARNIIYEANKLGVSVSDLNVIPNGRIFGTMNINGVSRFDRDVGSAAKQTLVNIIRATDIMAVQEIPDVSNQLDDELRNLGYDRASFIRPIISISPDSRKQRYESGTDFYYRRSVVDTEDCFEVRVSDGASAYGIYCRFRYKPIQKKERQCFHFFNVHLTYSSLTKRRAELGNLRKQINRLSSTTPECKNVLIGGDFNIGAKTNAIAEMNDVIRALPDMRFYDTGDTTPKDSSTSPESHYDHLLVSHSMRLLHRYYPPALPGKRLSELYKKFVPVSNVRNEPVARSYDLSDHLPVRFQDPPTGAKIGTWNLQYFNLFDVNVPDKKEFKHKEAYTRVFDHFHILALQELSGFASNLYGKLLIVSPVTNELGIAYDSNYVTLVGQCSDLKVTNSKGFSLRGMFGCTFETNGVNKKRVTVFSVHVENAFSTLKTGKLYQARAHEFAKEEAKKGRDIGKVYLAGDFNINKPSRSKPCKHKDGNSSWEYTRIPSKHIRDYVWDCERHTPGIENCEVLNPELMKDDDGNYLIPNGSTERMPLFANWKEISDHLPVMVQLNTE